MKNTSLLIALTLGLSTWACQNNTNQNTGTADTVMANDMQDTLHTSQNALDWAGTYEGVLPCADCPGIKTLITLKTNGEYTYQSEYLERDYTSVDSGVFEWTDNGSNIELMGNEKAKLAVGENQLIFLDTAGHDMTGPLAEHYVLKKAQ